MKRLDLSIYRYSTSCYFGQIYLHGADLLRKVRREMNTGEYFEGLRDYVADHYFEIGSTEVFLRTLQEHTNRDLEPLLAPWFPSLY
jgi:aminopeptidase N